MKCKNTKDGVKCGEVYAEEEGIKRTYLCEKHKNLAHFCNCGKYLEHRGFCSDKCHNKYYENSE